jgi:phage terminase large subunit-like protein
MVAQPFLEEWVARALERKIEVLRRPDPWMGEGGAARPEQRPPSGEWRTWLVMSGRGWGKTATGTQWVRWSVQRGKAHRVALVGSTAADVRDVMVEGPSGLLRACEVAGFPARYEPSRRRVLFGDGAVAYTYSAEEPDRLRGPQHDLAYCDELAAWQDPDAWDQLQFGLRLGENPQVCVTTTPRPVPLIRTLIGDSGTVVTRGSTFDNRDNLAPAFLDQVLKRYEGSRLYAQEVLGEIVEDLEGALWRRETIERQRVRPDELPELSRVVVAIDPQAGYDPESGEAETGIVVAGKDRRRNAYVLADRSGNYRPAEWAAAAVRAFHEFGADRAVIEVNQGGQMATQTLRSVESNLPIQEVRATRGKAVRAEPVSALYEQGRVFHAGVFDGLERQMTEWLPEAAGASPDRVDALVYAVQALLMTGGSGGVGWV